MTTVKDMSTTRKAAHYKGSRPRNQENLEYAESRVMPSRRADALLGRGSGLVESA